MTRDYIKSIALAFAIVLLIVFLFARKQDDSMPTDNYQNSQTNSAPETTPVVEATPTSAQPATPVANKKYLVTLNTTKGEIVIAMNFDQTPNTVNNFVTLAQKGFYNNVIFHRAIKGFMIQGGDPTGTGSGGPGYKFNDEPFTGEYTKGTVAMANAGPNTNGSQFFIMHADYALPKNYTIFGHVIKGIEVVDAIANDKVTMSSSGEMSKPVEPTKILTATVSEAQ
jgi:cyclophilin family peptidyl-prolyl cis-trans isomerase